MRFTHIPLFMLSVWGFVAWLERHTGTGRFFPYRAFRPIHFIGNEPGGCVLADQLLKHFHFSIRPGTGMEV